MRVVIDTNTYLHVTYLRPLFIAAKLGALRVYWSPPLQREIVKVVHRAHLSRLFGSDVPGNVGIAIRAAIDTIAEAVDKQMRATESVIELVILPAHDDLVPLTLVEDASDRKVLHTALVCDAGYLLSLDQRHFTHGRVIHGVECWHPDTFLTEFVQQNPTVFDQVSVLIAPYLSTVRPLLP